MNKTTYCFKIKSPVTDLLIGIGFHAAKESFPTRNDALKYREAYPEFFEFKPFLQNKNCQVVLVADGVFPSDVYGYVPINLVLAFITDHGGEVQ